MDFCEFQRRVNVLRSYSDAIVNASADLGIDLFDGIIGSLFDDLYMAFFGEYLPTDNIVGLEDDLCEGLGELIYGEEPNFEDMVELYQGLIV